MCGVSYREGVCIECSLVELSNGTVRMDARNNWYAQTSHDTKMFFLSSDRGQSWGAQQFDDSLSLDPTCQGGALTLSSSSGSVLLLSGPVADPRTPAYRARVNMSVHASSDNGDTFTSSQIMSGPSGYSSLSELPAVGESGGESVGLLFEQADKMCEPCLPNWKTAPGGCATRGLGAESCKISFVRLPVAALLSNSGWHDDVALAVPTVASDGANTSSR
jgi:hypothetical protein